ncbi:hypothetical protein [Staphylococcus gallinarum]|uniref:hypothetical protein n=2 Tax=Staphylococcus gallinarum TaxID=1293 RepID=UPI000D1CB4CF|nr:hypothetical protein [Staphylococcus gallinarum]MBU7217158.1 hypothetical protein [Staphylococcus gallinarum]PTE28339.1 hypothetical protein BUZ00_14045 [Staphylococcus gallinarum]PTK91833.1 hypothetical protein BUZ03_04295 [Staphylococcus gallinarum]RIL22889.1 hypothetical protein BUY99_06050 [Staphylococcus gallinarum]RIL24156.1 hypothetical protein BUY97_07695 [Staphylococcus gallinarum]
MKREEHSFLSMIINILAGILVFIAVLLSFMNSNNSQLPTLLALLGFTIMCIPSILKNKISGWIFGILGLILVILMLI